MSANEGFFAIDRRVWGRVCSLGMNPAVAYLMLARGTLADNRTTSWSTNALEGRTGISRPRAKDAIKTLVAAHLIEQRRGGSKPQYYLVPAHEVDVRKPAKPLTEEEARVLEVISRYPEGVMVPKTSRTGSPWPKGNSYSVACTLAIGGLVRATAGYHEFAPIAAPDVRVEPDWIWLPNTIIDGAASEVPPVELIRQTHCVAALRLFADLYHAQTLSDDGGVHWRQIRREYERVRVGEHAQFVVWGFRPTTERAWANAPPVAVHLTGKTQKTVQANGRVEEKDPGWDVFWGAFQTLEALGLVVMVPHAIEADTASGEVMHPYGASTGEPAERAIAEAAHAAGYALLNEARQQFVSNSDLSLLPVLRHIGEVQLVGLPRLRYRARTRATASWAAKASDWEAMAQRFREIELEALGTQRLATSMGVQW
ncbi:hypothetical protein [Methylobacterium sp. CM6257]